MKRTCLVIFILAVFQLNAVSQWYYKKYSVPDINLMTESQLNDALQKTKYNLVISAAGIVCGGALYYGGYYTIKNGLTEDATFLEELLGSEFMGNTYKVIGAGCVAAGVISGVIFMGRLGTIRSAINRNFPALISFNLEPVFIENPVAGTSTPAIRLAFSF